MKLPTRPGVNWMLPLLHVFLQIYLPIIFSLFILIAKLHGIKIYQNFWKYDNNNIPVTIIKTILIGLLLVMVIWPFKNDNVHVVQNITLPNCIIFTQM